jgi:hypothetical protein
MSSEKLREFETTICTQNIYLKCYRDPPRTCERPRYDANMRRSPGVCSGGMPQYAFGPLMGRAGREGSHRFVHGSGNEAVRSEGTPVVIRSTSTPNRKYLNSLFICFVRCPKSLQIHLITVINRGRFLKVRFGSNEICSAMSIVVQMSKRSRQDLINPPVKITARIVGVRIISVDVVLTHVSRANGEPETKSLSSKEALKPVERQAWNRHCRRRRNSTGLRRDRTGELRTSPQCVSCLSHLVADSGRSFTNQSLNNFERGAVLMLD